MFDLMGRVHSILLEVLRALGSGSARVCEPPARPSLAGRRRRTRVIGPQAGPGQARSRRILSALMLALTWVEQATAQEPGPDYALCLVARDGKAAYAEALRAEGWTLVEGTARGPALRGLAEVHYLHQRVARYFGDPPQSAEDLARGIAEAEREVADIYRDALVLTKGPAVVVVAVEYLAPSEGVVTCVLTAPDLPDADRMLASGEVFPFAETLVMTVAEPPPPPGASSLSIVAQRHVPRTTPVEPLVGLESVTVGLVIDGGS